MAQIEDAASVLEQFVHDVANLPAEIAHLLEEIQAKDQILQECRLYINKQDRIVQKHVKENGGHVKHPKDEQIHKAVLAKYDEAKVLQEQKTQLSEKACFLLDRHVKRLDLKIRDLQNDGTMLLDPQMPSLLRPSVGNLVDPVSGTGTGYSTPNPLAANHTNNSNQIANAAVARMISNVNAATRSSSAAPTATMQTQLPQRHRETSLGAASDGKRRRLNAPLNLGSIPAASSNLRQSSLGPSGTPKAGTPVSRAGSVGPRTKKPAKKLAPHQQQAVRKKASKNGISMKSRRRLIGGIKASPSSTGDDDSHTGSGSEDENEVRAQDGRADDDDAEDGGYDEEAEDTTLYCTCHSVSRGNMVACDNENCQYEWFHWDCVGLTEEPVGRWLCPTCVKLPKSQLKVAKG